MGKISRERNMVKKYVPKQGDIIYVNLDPIKGHEQRGERPAMVVSTSTFNRYTHLAMICPITSNTKDFPTHYILEDTKKIKGALLCEHIRSIDYENRNIKFMEKSSDNDLISVLTLLNACFEE